jgi:hypothetical protein
VKANSQASASFYTPHIQVRNIGRNSWTGLGIG